MAGAESFGKLTKTASCDTTWQEDRCGGTSSGNAQAARRLKHRFVQEPTVVTIPREVQNSQLLSAMVREVRPDALSGTSQSPGTLILAHGQSSGSSDSLLVP